MTILVTGSIAFDYIMDFQDRFKNHILPEKIHILNVSFFISDLKKEKGGTAANIAYSLALLGERPLLAGCVGKDFSIEDDIGDNIDKRYVMKKEDVFTANAHIMTDLDDNQITTFYPGAMMNAGDISISDIDEEINYAIISPNESNAMIKYVKECNDRGIKTFFDPGQQITTHSKETLIGVMETANYLILNDYELNLYSKITELSEDEIIRSFEKVIVTLGEKGSIIYVGDEKTEIDSVKVENIVDPTGCGDSFRSGLLRGLNIGLDWETSAKIGSLTASYCIQKYGTQNHSFTKDEFEKKFKESFGINLDLN
ncbi:MAG: carbohydrate kinase family protein [Candidatus Gracilibacteria bacterium]|nr:carbohydrate kinase family protein [Candidatus Gracilibacteria bacterium]